MKERHRRLSEKTVVLSLIKLKEQKSSVAATRCVWKVLHDYCGRMELKLLWIYTRLTSQASEAISFTLRSKTGVSCFSLIALASEMRPLAL